MKAFPFLPLPAGEVTETGGSLAGTLAVDGSPLVHATVAVFLAVGLEFFEIRVPPLFQFILGRIDDSPFLLLGIGLA